ncbi:MAG TPA: integration host factor subunit beta [Desulfobacteraceae bacterium]|nr:integration host factor subunit beta [Deltaproteobacteria bacterium]MBW2356318.1 integration host factor subunit beta [Deltaproteobacteria bacterium]RLB93431.1 MAG: integration host factor subunit beta [Deltaproteobacteria bacterium]HDI60355.1 integration host factor subunit beta [Desulfobacteraceae bacterium]
MNKSDLINALKDRAGLSRKEAETVVDTLFGTITETMAANNRVEIRGFGSFSVKQYKAYTGRNPKTGAQINVPAKKLPFFKVGKELKDKVDGK